MSVSIQDAANELLKRRRARASLLDYIVYTTPNYIVSEFAKTVCSQLDDFVDKMIAGTRPILILSAPPQHGKSEIVSRKLPAFLLSRFPYFRVAAASYNSKLAGDMGIDVRRNLASPLHLKLFPVSSTNRKFVKNRMAEFTSPYGAGSYIGDGIGGGFTGKSADIFIIDDPIKNNEEALSETTKESVWNWYQSTSKTRMSKNSGLIVMATRWAEDDLSARIEGMITTGSDRLKHLKFPAINSPDEAGYNSNLPEGPLIPELHPIEQLLEFKHESSDYWWSAQYQQEPKSLGGNVFKAKGIRFYRPHELPTTFDLIIDSWDCTFKDTDGTDYVCGGKWGKKGANAYLLAQRHKRMGFVETAEEVEALAKERPVPSEILIEDKANGPAVIDFLKKRVPRLLAIEPDGSKLARAHAVTSVWEAGNVWLPHPENCSWVTGSSKTDHFIAGSYLGEMTGFPAASNDDWVDMTTQALRRLFPFFGKLAISAEVLKKAGSRVIQSK